MLAILAGTGAPALAAFPERPIRLIIGFPAGGPLDTHARLLADRLQQLLGQPIIIDYKPGAGGSIGAEFVPNRRRTAYAAGGQYRHHGDQSGALSKLPYTMLRDLVPVARTASSRWPDREPGRAGTRYPQFIRYAKANPGKLNYASAGNGGISPGARNVQTGHRSSWSLPYRGSRRRSPTCSPVPRSSWRTPSRRSPST
jgi:tripartite-type tricarboxylate transporter receptor subunit TctC